jgi:Smg protein
MKQTVLDVLIYMFEHYIGEEGEFSIDQHILRKKLTEAGFDDNQVTKAFDWLDGLAANPEVDASDAVQRSTGFRIHNEQELRKIDVEGRGFLLYLEQIGVLDVHNREQVIDALMSLESDEIELEQVKWVVLMVLFNQPGQSEALGWMEGVILDGPYGNLH